MFPNIFTDDAFGLITLSAVVNSVDTIPGRAGELAFNGVAEPLATTAAAIESDGVTLTLVKSTKRGAPAEKETTNKAVIRSIGIPHFKVEDTIQAASVQDVRQLGSADVLRSARSVVDRQLLKSNQRLDLTLESLRLGALRGIVLDSDATTIVNLFTFFGVAEPTAFDFSDSWGNPTDGLDSLRAKCQEVVRYMKRNIKLPWSPSAKIWALCGDNFFDRLVSSVGVKDTAAATALAKIVLGSNYAHGVFEFGGIYFENYQGTDDNSTVAVASDDARFFVTGVPGLYTEYYAPGTFWSAVNTMALPRYAKVAPDTRFEEYVETHVQMNPLPFCTRPLTLVRGAST